MNKNFFNAFLLSKVPIARIAGLKLHALDDQRCQIAVRLGWLNQNPFKSMFWAVEGMAAEFSTGTLCMSKIRKTGIAVSMLVANLQAGFTKKAVGKIIFTCEQGAEVDAVLRRVIETGEAQSLRLRSVGVDEQGDQVAEFFFTWSFKARVDR